MKLQIGPQGKKILNALLYTILALLLTFVFFKLSIIFLPIVVAFLLSSLLEPVVGFLTRKTKLNRTFATLLTMLSVFLTVGTALFFVISKLVSEIISLSQFLRDNYTYIEKSIKFQTGRIQSMYKSIPKEAADSINNILAKLGNYILSLLQSIASSVLNTAISIPNAIVFIIVVILATYFITSDKNKIHDFIQEQLPQKWYVKAAVLLEHIFKALIQYVKAQLILVSVTIAVLAISFTVVGIKYSILIAFVIGFIDALPVFGVGSVMVPWIIYQFIFGDVKIGIALLVIYAIVYILRQILEPKIFGSQMGVHPLLALAAMYVGFNYFGIAGLILSPIIIMIVKNILNEYIENKSFRKLFENESDNQQEINTTPQN